MSFRRDGQQRYGHVPPVQYPVAGQQYAQSQPPHQNQGGVERRLSFNSGDDGAYYGATPGQLQSQQTIRASDYPPHPSPGQSEDELFLGSPPPSSNSSGQHQQYAQANNAMSGYQHRYQDTGGPPTPTHATYNPQSFAAPQSGYQPAQPTTTLPHHPHPSTLYSTNHSSYTSQPLAGYAPQTYNPAAYATTVPQRHPTYHEQYGGSDAQGYNSAVPQRSSTYGHGQSPGIAQQATFQQSYSPNYQQNQFSPPIGGRSPNSQNSYDPSHYSSGQYSAHASDNSSPAAALYSQAPYPTGSHIPAGPSYDADQRASPYNRDSRSNSQTSPMSGSPLPAQQPSPGLRRHPTNAPLPNRPMDEVPEESNWNTDGQNYSDSYDRDQERLMKDIEAELGGIGARHPPTNGQYQDDQLDQLTRYDSNATTLAHTASRSTTNKPASTLAYESDDDDPEGAAGVLAMQQAEWEDRRFSGATFSMGQPAPAVVQNNNLPPPAEEQSHSSDSDYGGMVDLGMLSGGYDAGPLAYGKEVSSVATPSQDSARPLPQPSLSTQGTAAFSNAQMDYGGTGGLQAPTVSRRSFDEGDERSLHSRQSGTESPTKDEYQDLFYHPGLTNRPLPALPPGPGSDSSSMLSVNTNVRPNHHRYSNSYGNDPRMQAPDGPEAFYQSASGYSPQPERSISLSGHSNTPPVHTPVRSRTDAADERKKMFRHQHVVSGGSHGPTISEYEGADGGAFDAITIPKKKKFIPNKLTATDFRRCVEPWALSGIESWVREMADGEIDLREKTVEEALVLLFTFKVPMMNVADAELLSGRIVVNMIEAKLLIRDEEWVKFGNGHITGVLWQMTGSGCYASKLHDQEIGGRCYSPHCTRTLKKVDLADLDPENTKPTDDWHVFYGLKKEDWESKPKKEVDRQNILHEIVTGEENYIKQLDLFRILYRDDLRVRNPPILHPDKRDKFLAAVFGKLDTVLRINKNHLLAQLKYRQQEQGPWITGFSDLFREWIRKAKSDYIEYAIGYPRAQYMVRKEADRNVLFKRFLDEKQKHKSSSKQDWTHFLITPLQRLQRYILLLESIDGKMITESEEKTNLQKAIQEIKTVTLECDAKVEETNKRVQMMELDRMLVLRPGFQSILNLDHLGRQLIMEGELTRLGSRGMKWVDTHGLLFDHYLILAKIVLSRDGRGEKKYDVSREPIPMPLLFLESMNDEPVQRQKGITAPLGRTTAAGTSTVQLNKIASNGGRPTLEHAPTSSSMSSNNLTPTGSSDPDGKILYPFKVKHLGHEVYTLYATSSRDRMEWCEKIISAKTNHAKALFSQNAEPFRLRVLADAAFHYDAASPYARASSVAVKGTPLDRAIEELEGVLGPATGIPPVCRAQVNCATGFSAFGKSVIAIGTDYGVFISDPSNPRGWSRSVQASRVTQIAVLEEFSVCLVIADRSLISYPLDVIAPVSEFAPPVNDSPRRAPHRLAKDVTYFATAKMKDRMLIFYKRKEGLHTTFKVLEPIYNKATEKKRFFGAKKTTQGGTEGFRDFDEFFFPTECYSLSLFQTYISVATSKGFEMLTLDKKHPMSIPDLRAPAIANIASRIQGQKPLGMFRLNENEFILTYEDCAVYVDKHGDISRTLIMEYTGKQKKARGSTMYGQYLLLFNEDYVEVRNAENGRLRQIIAGRDVRVLDMGVRGPTGGNAAQSQHTVGRNGQLANIGDASKGTVKIAMCHPELPGRQIILEMLLNDGHADS